VAPIAIQIGNRDVVARRDGHAVVLIPYLRVLQDDVITRRQSKTIGVVSGGYTSRLRIRFVAHCVVQYDILQSETLGSRDVKAVDWVIEDIEVFNEGVAENLFHCDEVIGSRWRY
jgi:hypothetical protein